MEGSGADASETLDLGEVEASFFLGDLDPEAMPGISLRALAVGYDGPALLELARMSSPTVQDAGDLFERALVQTGRPSLPRDEAGLRVARTSARKVVSGEVDPYEGAHLIWVKVWDRCGRPDELSPFVGLSSLYEADPQRRPLHLGEIVARAEELADDREDS